MTEISYEVRERDLIAFNEHLAQQSEDLRKQFRRHQAQVPGFMVLVSLLLWFYYKDSLSAIYVAVIALAWGFGVPAYMKWSLRRQIRGLYSSDDRASILGKFSLRVDPANLVEVNATGESFTPWQDVLRIEVTKKYAFVFVGPRAALIVPRATISKGNLHEFIKAADERISQADSVSA
ncbi:YcxB family protein [Methylolobus aquaticus]|nr:YcxB family protein [Methylolobus aquaticus]